MLILNSTLICCVNSIGIILNCGLLAPVGIFLTWDLSLIFRFIRHRIKDFSKRICWSVLEEKFIKVWFLDYLH